MLWFNTFTNSAIVNINVVVLQFALCFIVVNDTGLKIHVRRISTYCMHNKHVSH
jgi:hypothetical protein